MSMRSVACALFAVTLLDARPALSANDSKSAVPQTTINRNAIAGSSIGPAMVHALGPRAVEALAPTSGLLGALVAVPKGKRAEDFGLEPLSSPNIARLRGTPAKIEAFGKAHPDLRVEIAPPLHPLMDRAARWVYASTARNVRGADGKGVLVGVADTGLDVTHPDFLDADGNSRVAWLLDLSLEPGFAASLHPELEEKFGIKDDFGKIQAGRVFDNFEINSLLERIRSGKCDEKKGLKCAPSDEIGHGTHVTGIAAGSGIKTPYGGIAPKADIIFVRIVRGKSEGIENDDLVRAVEFMFDRADAMKLPMVANLSLGSDFGPHDGTFLWEQQIATHVGPDKPGHVIVAAAGNSGSIAETPIHQSVRVTDGSRLYVPVRTGGADSGSVQIWVTLRNKANLKIGLEGPDGEWIAPVEEGHQNGKNTDEYNAGVIYGPGHENSPIPPASRGAVVVWQGAWPKGTYWVSFEGEGMADLYLQGLGDASLGSDRRALFVDGVREGTVNLPATHPALIAVGCTVNKVRWTSIANAEAGVRIPVLDGPGGLPIGRTLPADDDSPRFRDLTEGEVCWFSSSGPTVTGVPKPEISAPGVLVVSAMSRTAKPGSPGSVFTHGNCPLTKGGVADRRCLQIDEGHGITSGTSMSSPVVAGVVALLLQQDPTLTQDKVVALLQAGAHRFRAAPPFEDQGGPGEVDAIGALDALEQMRNGKLYLPAASESWVTLSSDYVAADGSTPLTAIVELRTANAEHRADLFEANRLQAVVLVDGKPVDPPPALIRRGPGVWFYTWTPGEGLGGSRATFGATFDGQPIVIPKTVPIASDGWTASYPSYAKGSGCALGNGVGTASGWSAIGLALAAIAIVRTARLRRLTPPQA